MYTLIPKDRLALTQALIRALCGEAHLSLEGDLSRCIIERRGELQFATFDNFDSAAAGDGLSESFLVSPMQRRVLRSYYRNPT
jgi:hypothetical protein